MATPDLKPKNIDLQHTDCMHGPLGRLNQELNKKILISLTSNKKLLANLLHFNVNFNLLLTDVKEMWSEMPKNPKAVSYTHLTLPTKA